LCEGCRQYHDEVVFVKRRVSSMDALAQAPASELATFTAPPAGLRRLPFSRPTALRQSLAYLGLALWRGSQTWRIASSAIAILAVASLIYSFLLPRSPQRALLSQAAPVSASTVPIELAPTFAIYHVFAYNSL